MNKDQPKRDSRRRLDLPRLATREEEETEVMRVAGEGPSRGQPQGGEEREDDMSRTE